MSPRDLWDLNPVYSLEFWGAYENVLSSIGFIEDREELVNPRNPEIAHNMEDMEDDTNEGEAESDTEDYDWRYDEYYNTDTDIETEDDYSDWGDDLADLPSMDDIVSFM